MLRSLSASRVDSTRNMNEQKIKINNIDDSIKTNENNEIKFQTNDARDKKYVTKNEMLKNKILATLSIPILE